MVKSLGKATAGKHIRVKAEFERCEEDWIYQPRVNSYPSTNNKFQFLQKSHFLFPFFLALVKWKAPRKIISLCQSYFFALTKTKPHFGWFCHI